MGSKGFEWPRLTSLGGRQQGRLGVGGGEHPAKTEDRPGQGQGQAQELHTHRAGAATSDRSQSPAALSRSDSVPRRFGRSSATESDRTRAASDARPAPNSPNRLGANPD